MAFIDYKRPGKIINRKLVEENSMQYFTTGLYQIKAGLIEHHDYEAVSQDIWKYLSSWYLCDISIPRFLQYDAETEKTCLEIYPKITL